MENQSRSRSHQILFRVSNEEYTIIRRKMIMSWMRNREAFIRKLLIEGDIINIDTAPLEDIFYERCTRSARTSAKSQKLQIRTAQSARTN